MSRTTFSYYKQEVLAQAGYILASTRASFVQEERLPVLCGLTSLTAKGSTAHHVSSTSIS